MPGVHKALASTASAAKKLNNKNLPSKTGVFGAWPRASTVLHVGIQLRSRFYAFCSRLSPRLGFVNSRTSGSHDSVPGTAFCDWLHLKTVWREATSWAAILKLSAGEPLGVLGHPGHDSLCAGEVRPDQRYVQSIRAIRILSATAKE